MALERINPDTLFKPNPEASAQVIVSTGGRQVFVNGQISRDADAAMIGEGDLEAQLRQCWSNVKDALAAAGATGLDVVQYRTYVVDPKPGDAKNVTAIGREVFGAEWPVAPASFVGVPALGFHAYLVQIEAQAIVA
ncbi:RidA family protein [Frondihabitans cladoniiphilus]|uniref:RidA family protein n=1 Tax=Frondihabitans cladoniiphilus TaxID=715785 RepID=A0ABP8W4R8_9MICO